MAERKQLASCNPGLVSEQILMERMMALLAGECDAFSLNSNGRMITTKHTETEGEYEVEVEQLSSESPTGVFPVLSETRVVPKNLDQDS